MSKRENAIKEGFLKLAEKEISIEEMKEYVEETLVKVFNRDKGWKPLTEDEPLGDVSAEFDIETGKMKVTRKWVVVDKVDPEKILIQISKDSEEAEGKEVGDIVEKNIDVLDQDASILRKIKQLLVQKIREKEKEKLYEKFSKHEGTLVLAQVIELTERSYILEYEDTHIELPLSETLQSDRIANRDWIKVYITNIEKSGNKLPVASRNHPNFIKSILMEEVDDLQDGVIEIVSIARIPSFKTKVAVRSTLPEVDPVGAIVGVNGSRIRQLMNIIGGERIDIIQYSDNMEEYVSSALTPAVIKGVKYEEKDAPINKEKDNKYKKDEENDENEIKKVKTALVVVEDDQFLTTLGKGGKNVKLAVMLTGVHIDVKKMSEAKESNLEYNEIQTKFTPRSQQFNDFIDVEFQMNTDSLDELANFNSDEEIDYNEYSMEANKIREEDEIKREEFVPNYDSSEITIDEEAQAIEENQAIEDFDREEGDLFDDSYDEYIE